MPIYIPRLMKNAMKHQSKRKMSIKNEYKQKLVLKSGFSIFPYSELFFCCE